VELISRFDGKTLREFLPRPKQVPQMRFHRFDFSAKSLAVSVRSLALAAIVFLVPYASSQGRQQGTPQQGASGSTPQSSQQHGATPAAAPSAAPTLPQAKITDDVRMVTVYATVADKHGKLMPDLTRGDFTLSQESQPEQIAYFAREKDLPLTIGLLIDTSRSQQTVLPQERTASYSFLDHMLRDEKDRAFIIHFDQQVELLQDLTPSRPKLKTALDNLNAPQLERASDSDSQGHSNHGGGTLLYDSIFLASNELMKKEKGRKALVILSDGVDRGSKELLSDAIEAAQRANTVIFAIYFKGDEPHDYGGGHHGGWGSGGGGGGPYGQHGGGHRYPQEDRPDGKKILERIAKETGGRLFEATKKQSADDIYTEIAEQLRDQYILGYSPQKDQAGEGYHKIQVAVKNKDLTVQARDGYYGE
jgi:VWFA-related protein